MADPQLLKVPGIAARIATWAAQDERDDAVDRGDAAAEVLAQAGLWGFGGTWSLAKMDYDASLASTRRAFWASGEGLKGAPLLDSTLEAQTQELYDDLYPGLAGTWPVRKGVAVAAANKGNDALALMRGKQAARAMRDAGVWNLVDLGTYLAKTDAEKLAFWRAGGVDLYAKYPVPASKGGASPAPTPPATEGPSWFTGLLVLAGLGVGYKVWKGRTA